MTANSTLGTGTVISLVFLAPNASTTFTAKYRQIGAIPRNVEVIDDTHLGTTGYREKRAGDLIDVDPIDCEIFANPGKEVPLGKVATITITYPPGPGQTNGPVFTASGFISQDSGAAASPGAQMVGTYQLVLDGKTTKPAWTPGS